VVHLGVVRQEILHLVVAVGIEGEAAAGLKQARLVLGFPLLRNGDIVKMFAKVHTGVRDGGQSVGGGVLVDSEKDSRFPERKRCCHW
jgi:hypothetical protein